MTLEEKQLVYLTLVVLLIMYMNDLDPWTIETWDNGPVKEIILEVSCYVT